MAKPSPLGILRIEGILYYVHHLDTVRSFFMNKLDFAEIGCSSPELNARGKQRSAVLEAGACRFLLCSPEGEGGRAWRYLRKHPEGVGTIVFEVEEIDRTFRLLEERGATPISDVMVFEDEGGKMAMFSITTPFGDTTFRFVERQGHAALFPGFIHHAKPIGGENAFAFGAIDHVTSNFQTMAPALLWMEHVLGFERFWSVNFHTRDVSPDAKTGTGLRSVVMIDPGSGIKFANNEPVRPFFKESQINVFAEDHRGDGVQHAALTTKDILAAVAGLRERGVEFMHTPGAYYDMLPERLVNLGVGTIDEDIARLRELEILVDGEGAKKYLLQIFLKESAQVFGHKHAGPFFFEIIKRKGSKGFGAGNFRALFESIEREQALAGAGGKVFSTRMLS